MYTSGQDEDNIKDESDLPDNEPLREQVYDYFI